MKRRKNTAYAFADETVETLDEYYIRPLYGKYKGAPCDGVLTRKSFKDGGRVVLDGVIVVNADAVIVPKGLEGSNCWYI